jgi:hypothetical protein
VPDSGKSMVLTSIPVIAPDFAFTEMIALSPVS